MQLGVVSRHADLETKFAQRVARVILHSRDVVILIEAVTVIDKYRHDGNAQCQRQQHRDHQFDD